VESREGSRELLHLVHPRRKHLPEALLYGGILEMPLFSGQPQRPHAISEGGDLVRKPMWEHVATRNSRIAVSIASR
jgi:hypothetical protein